MDGVNSIPRNGSKFSGFRYLAGDIASSIPLSKRAVLNGQIVCLDENGAELRRLLSKVPLSSRMRYVEHVERNGIGLFELICERDLEGIVAKLKHEFCQRTREEHLVQDPQHKLFPESWPGKIVRERP